MERFTRREVLLGAAAIPVVSVGLVKSGLTERVTLRHIKALTKEETTEPLPYSSNPDVEKVERRRDIRLISAKDAYEKLLLSDYDVTDRREFRTGENSEWDSDTASILDKCLDVLPEYFYGRSGNGETLHIAKSDFGTNKEGVGARYIEDPGRINSIKTDLILLDDSNFNVSNFRISLQTLTHELIHRFQNDSDNREKHAKILDGILGGDTQSIFKKTENKLDDSARWSEDTEYYQYFLDNLKYGVVNAKSGEIRSDYTEFEASVAEIYLEGFDKFHKFFRRIYGGPKADALYVHMRDNVFGGITYEFFPTDPLTNTE